MLETILTAIVSMFKGKFLEVLLLSSIASFLRFIAILLNITKLHSNRPLGEIFVLILLDIVAMGASILIGLTTWLVATSAGKEEWEIMVYVILSSILGFNAISALVKVTFDSIINTATGLTTGYLKLKLLKITKAITKGLKS